MKHAIVLIGGGGHCKSVIDVIQHQNKYEIAGILDIKGKVGMDVLGYPIIGTDDDLGKIIQRYSIFHITIGQILSNSIRVSLFNYLKEKEIELPIIAAKDAYISRYATIGRGSFIGHRAFVNAGAVIGENTIVNTGAIIEHDSVIGDHSHISTMCTINADCKVGSHSFLSSHAVLNRGTELAHHSIVYSGAVVTKSYFEPGISLSGVPAKIHS